MPSRPSAVRIESSLISAVTPTAWPYPQPPTRILDGEEVRFRWRDHRHGGIQRVMPPSVPSSSCDASSCMSCPGASCASATTACCRTVSENSCCPWRVNCSLRKAASHCLCRRPPTAISGTVPVAAHPCASLNASPPQNSILQVSILHDRRCQPALQACSMHAFAVVCSLAPSTLRSHPNRLAETPDRNQFMQLLNSSEHPRRQ